MGEKNGSLFTWRIFKAQLPRKFSTPAFKIYNDRSDPVDHVRRFQHAMSYWSYDEALMYRMFPSSLGGGATRWFFRFPVGQIDSFKELIEQFTARFIMNNRIIKGLVALTTMREKSNETLRKYFARY